MSAPTHDRYRRVSSVVSEGVASIVERCINTPGVGRVFAPVSPNWFATDSRYYALDCIRVSSVIGIRSFLKMRPLEIAAP